MSCVLNKKPNGICLIQKCTKCEHWKQPDEIFLSINDIKELHEKTGVGTADAKRILALTNGNFEEAIELVDCSKYAVIAKCPDYSASK